MEGIFYLLATVIILKGLVGVLQGLHYRRYFQREINDVTYSSPAPVSVIVPCKGQDFELAQNLQAMLDQDYEDYEVIFVTASDKDSSLPVIHEVVKIFPSRRVKIVRAGFSEGQGEKVNNLIQGIHQSDRKSQVLVFADSDGRPHRLWLKDLLKRLYEPNVGASSGYRWFFPRNGNFASVLRASWNGAIASLLGNHKHNFAWGGSTAIQRSNLKRINLLKYWEHTISDDFSLTEAVHNACLHVHFEPRCLVSSHGDCTWSELLEWSSRQIIITKIYSRSLWKLTFLSEVPFVLFFCWALGKLVWLISTGVSTVNSAIVTVLPLSILIGVVFLLSSIRGFLRWEMVRSLHPEEKECLDRDWWGYLLLAPLVSTLTIYNLIISLFSSTVRWRGVYYDLKSKNEVHIIHDTKKKNR